MDVTEYEVRPGVYFDSVVLMQLQKSLADLPGVVDAGVVMATPANCDLLAAADFNLDGIEAKADDLLIVIKAVDKDAAQSALGMVDELAQKRRSKISDDFRPRSLAGAVNNSPEAGWVLISVPGRYAAGVAEEALDLNQHVFLYSDNVSLEDELALKVKAREKGLLLMGPDCGTAVVNGVGLGFANHVRRGAVGLIAASGTGLQAVTSGIHNKGGGISQAIGTGGRDLKSEINGITTLQAIDLLRRDERTEVIVVVSKPIDSSVAATLVRAAQNCGKPVILNLLGYPPPARQIGNLYFATTLDEAAFLAVSVASEDLTTISGAPAEGTPSKERYMRGLFSGGTLAYEALVGLQTFLSPIFSNIPLRPEQNLENLMISQAHTILDLGEDAFTQGRLHPMMDNDLRLRRMHQEAADPSVGVILLDVVLGEGAHPDPASEIAPEIAAIKEQRDMEFLAIVLGTDEDPQDVERQIEELELAGAAVVRQTDQAVAAVSELLRSPYQYGFAGVSDERFGDELVAINVGLESFHESLLAQGAESVQVEWRPPAGGDDDLMAILAKMKGI